MYSTEPLPHSESGAIDARAVDFDQVLIHEDLKGILERQMQLNLAATGGVGSGKMRYLKGNLETIRNIINYNGGKMLLPKIALPFFPADQRQRIYSFVEFQPELDVRFIAARAFHKNRLIKRLIEELRAVVAPETLLT